MKKRILLIVLILIILIDLIFGIYKLTNKKIVFDENRREYSYNNLVVTNEMIYDTENKLYSFVGTIDNKSNKDYKEVILTIEMYDSSYKKIDKYDIKVSEIKANSKSEYSIKYNKTKALIYDYKVVKIKEIK